MKLYIAIDVSDDDVSMQDIAQQCGYDLKHPAVHDVSAPEPALYHGEPCLVLRLHLLQDISPAELLAEATVLISHPSVSAVRPLWLEA
jgi:hypothetical protein